MAKPEKSTPVTVQIKGESVSGDYSLGFHADDYHGFVWGLVDRFGWMTQMRYGGDYAVSLRDGEPRGRRSSVLFRHGCRHHDDPRRDAASLYRTRSDLTN